MTANILNIIRPDDWHLHLRDGDGLAAVLPHTAERFSRAIVMPNLKPPIVTVDDALAYRQRILAALQPKSGFEPLMTLYLTAKTTPEDIREAAECPYLHAVKYYPAGATTHSEFGLSALSQASAVLETMEEVGLPLLLHGEVTHSDCDIFDREGHFIEQTLDPLLRNFSAPKVVFEHITTKLAADFVRTGPATLAATLTPQHLLHNRNDLLAGGIRPHYYCLPILKREEDRQALLDLATSGFARVFLGTDSAPHGRSQKENACGCAGIYSAHAAIELYAEAFEQVGCLEKLEGFASIHGPRFYGLPVNKQSITLRKTPWQVPETYPMGDGDVLVPLAAGKQLNWTISPHN